MASAFPAYKASIPKIDTELVQPLSDPTNLPGSRQQDIVKQGLVHSDSANLDSKAYDEHVACSS